MRLQLRKPSQALDKAYARQPIPQEQMDVFRQALAKLFLRVDEKESEEHQQTIVADFLRESFHTNSYRVGKGEGIDLLIQAESYSSDTTAKAVTTAVIETRKVFAGEMVTPLKNNVRALHELILYYFENAEREPSNAVCQLAITDVYNWFLFDERDFRRFFYDNIRLKKLFQVRQQQKKGDTYFFAETARILRDLDAEVPVTYLNLRETADALALSPEAGDRFLVPVVKLFSPTHLLKQPFDNGTDAFNQPFYEELLHIIGIYEQPVGKKSSRMQRLPESERAEGSLLENTISQIQQHNVLAGLDEVNAYGATEEDQLVTIGLDLCLTWLTRVLFLKVNESQLFPSGLPAIHDFVELNELFFDVMAVDEKQRSEEVHNRFTGALYLNCPLFTETDLERKTIRIRDLANTLKMDPFVQTTVASSDDEVEPLTTLHYLLAFLNGYDFSIRPLLVVQKTSKPRISAAILGLIFEKINNQHNGSPPGNVVTYMVRNAVRKAIVSAFTPLPELAAEPARSTSVDELKKYVSQFHEPNALLRFSAIFNSIRIVDPAVGSGRFLVSALHELIVLKAELGLLVDHDGQRIHQLDVSVIDDELLITDANGELFEYILKDGIDTRFSSLERQRIQTTIFREKQTILENCLFGVDHEAVSVNFCQFRLWTELLKSAFFAENQYFASPIRQQLLASAMKPSGQDTTPADQSLQVTLNLKIGDSLVSRFDPNFQGDGLKMPIREKFLNEIKQYKADVLVYKQSREEPEKSQRHAHTREIEATLNQLSLVDQKETATIRRLEARLAQSALPFDADGQDNRIQKLTDQLTIQKKTLADKQRLFQQAIEWRYMFPEVLDDGGNYVGFDLVLGCPPFSQSDGFTRVKTYFQRAFPNTYTSKVEPYALFVELGIKLLKPGGELFYWLPEKWLKAGNAGKLRDWIKTWTATLIDNTGLSFIDENTSVQRILTVQKVLSASTPTPQS